MLGMFSMRWKIVGMVTVIAASCSIGYIWAMEARIHLDELKQMERMIRMIQSEMHYQCLTLSEVFRKVGEKQVGMYKQWFLSISNNLKEKKGNRFLEIWDDSIEVLSTSECQLTTVEIEQLKSLGKAFGESDPELQDRLIEQYLRGTEYSIREEQRELKGKQKLRCTLGVSIGLLLTILLM